MSEEERAELLAQIYGADHDEPGPTGLPIYDPLKSDGRSTVIQINGRSVEIPNMGYVLSLERTVKEQGRELRRLAGLVDSTRGFLRRQSAKVGDARESARRHMLDLQGQLDRKIDGHDHP